MVDEHLDNMMQVDILTPEQSRVQWINFGPDIDLNNFEKIDSGGSTYSYIMLSLTHPNVCMRVKLEDFFRSLLQKRADELFNSRASVARLDSAPAQPESDLRRGVSSGTKGLPGNIDPNNPPKCDELTAKNGQRHTTKNTKDSWNTAPSRSSGPNRE